MVVRHAVQPLMYMDAWEYVPSALVCAPCLPVFLLVCMLYAGHPYIHLISFEIFLLALCHKTAKGRGGDIGGQGVLGPPTFYPGGAEHPKLFDHRTEQNTKIALLLARNLHCKKRINFQAQLIKQTRGFAFVF